MEAQNKALCAYILKDKMTRDGRASWLVVTHGSPASENFTRVALEMVEEIASDGICLLRPSQTHGEDKVLGRLLKKVSIRLACWLHYSGAIQASDDSNVSNILRSKIESMKDHLAGLTR